MPRRMRELDLRFPSLCVFIILWIVLRENEMGRDGQCCLGP